MGQTQKVSLTNKHQHKKPGNDLLSQDLTTQVPSAQEDLTTVFEKETGVTPPQSPPKPQKTWKQQTTTKKQKTYKKLSNTLRTPQRTRAKQHTKKYKPSPN